MANDTMERASALCFIPRAFNFKWVRSWQRSQKYVERKKFLVNGRWSGKWLHGCFWKLLGNLSGIYCMWVFFFHVFNQRHLLCSVSIILGDWSTPSGCLKLLQCLHRKKEATISSWFFFFHLKYLRFENNPPLVFLNPVPKKNQCSSQRQYNLVLKWKNMKQAQFYLNDWVIYRAKKPKDFSGFSLSDVMISDFCIT